MANDPAMMPSTRILQFVKLYAIFYSFRWGVRYNAVFPSVKGVVRSLEQAVEDLQDYIPEGEPPTGEGDIPTARELLTKLQSSPGHDYDIDFNDGGTWCYVSVFEPEQVEAIIEAVKEREKRLPSRPF